MSEDVVICENMPQLRLDVPEITDPESPTRGLLEAISGAYTVYSADGLKSMKLISSKAGLESLEALPYITVTTYDEIEADADLLALYKSIYPYDTPDAEGNTRPFKFVEFA